MNEDYEKGYDRGVLDTVEECQRLEHNWNELKKYIEKEKSRFGSYRYDEILNKIKELEEGGNNERTT